MSKTGFAELSFGIESLRAERVEFIGKSMNGKRYVADAKKTIFLTAKAGIMPTFYMILTDPKSSLRDIAYELMAGIQLIKGVYIRTSILPKISWSLCLLPTAGSEFARRYPYTTNRIRLARREIDIPSEYVFNEETTLFLQKADASTCRLPHALQNLESLHQFLLILENMAVNSGDKQLLKTCEVGLREYADLCNIMAVDVEDTADALLKQYRERNNKPLGINLRFNTMRFGGNMHAIESYYKSLKRALSNDPLATP